MEDNLPENYDQSQVNFQPDRITLWLAVIIFLSILTIISIITYLYFSPDLVSAQIIINKNDTGVILEDRLGRPFFTLYEAKPKTYIPLSDIPTSVQEALIASEDKDFYSHPGFSPKAIIRSLLTNIEAGDITNGGSTITQQLVKNSLLTPQKNLIRKYQEIILAEEIEKRYSKAQILEMYLNTVYFGQGAFGIENAAQAYFNKPAKSLDLAQSALLVSLLPAPSSLDPLTGNWAEARDRQHLVLQKMVEQNYITKETAQEAEKEELKFNPQPDNLNTIAPHFALMVRDELLKKYSEEELASSGMVVKTTLDLDWQTYVEKEIKVQVANLRKNNVSNGAVVVIDPKTGEIKALAGSVNWSNEQYGKVNMATSPRQSGSSFKPIVYAAAFEEGLITPATILKDAPTAYGNYKPVDYDHKFRGQVTVRRALANSLNVPSVQVMDKVGVSGALEMAHRLGVTTLQDPQNYGLSLVLGAGEVPLMELTDVYATFANQGLYNPPTTILEIQDKSGQTIYHYQPDPQPVLKPEITFLISSILSDNKTRAEIFGTALNISRPSAVKTGTTENFKDALTLGYTPSLAVGVWIGNNDNASMDNVAGSLGAAPLWKNIMEKFLAGTPVENFTAPAGIVSKTICTTVTKPKDPNSPDKDIQTTVFSSTEYFIKGTEPSQSCTAPLPTGPAGGAGGPAPSASPSPTSGLTPTPSPTALPSPMPTLFITSITPLRSIRDNQTQED